VTNINQADKYEVQTEFNRADKCQVSVLTENLLEQFSSFFFSNLYDQTCYHQSTPPHWKMYTNQGYSCPRNWCISASWGPNWWPPWNLNITALWYWGAVAIHNISECNFCSYIHYKSRHWFNTTNIYKDLSPIHYLQSVNLNHFYIKKIHSQGNFREIHFRFWLNWLKANCIHHYILNTT